MKKAILLKESELINMIKTIAEQVEVDLDQYDDSDFIDVFVFVFRNWINNRLGDEAKKYPFSFLVKKYGQRFLEDTFADEYGKFFGGDRDVDFNLYNLPRIGKKLVKAGAYTLKTLRTEEKFTEKFAKKIPRIVKMLNLPEWAKFEFYEKKPHQVEAVLHVDYPSFLKFENGRSLHTSQLDRELRELFENYLGVEFGNPAHGEVQLNVDSKVENEESWIKNVLNKEIKKHIKSMPGGKFIHSIRFVPKFPNNSEMKLIFKDEWGRRNFSEWQFRDEVKKYIKELGYNKIDVDN